MQPINIGKLVFLNTCLISWGQFLLYLGLFQKDVAVTIGVDTNTIANWEKGWTEPELRYIPRILTFLGYELDGLRPVTLGERIKWSRYLWGISQKEMARRIGIDPTTLSRLEKESGKVFPCCRKKPWPMTGACLLDCQIQQLLHIV